MKKIIIVAIGFILSTTLNAQIINTVAGGGFWKYEGKNALNVAMRPNTTAFDSKGNLYYFDYYDNVIRKISTNNTVTTIAGNGTLGFSGDGGPAILAQFQFDVAGIAVDSSGNIFVNDKGNSRIRKISNKGIITTIAGNGTVGFSGDGGQATSAQINFVVAIACDAKSNVFIIDGGLDNFKGGNIYPRIRKISSIGIITTIAGNGTLGFSGDGGPAILAQLNYPYSITADNIGNVFIGDGSRIRKISSDGNINTIAGNGTSGYSGDGGQSINAEISFSVITVDNNGILYLEDPTNNLVRKISISGIITTIAGIGTVGYSGDGGNAVLAQFSFNYGPNAISCDGLGNVYIIDDYGFKIRKISSNGIIVSIAGNGKPPGYSGDGGSATSAQLNWPVNNVIDKQGNMFVSDQNNYVIRKISKQGIVSTYAGNGFIGNSLDGSLAINSPINPPGFLTCDYNGNLYFSDGNENQIKKISTTGIISTYAGIGTIGFSGDGGSATSAQLNYPNGLSFDKVGNLYFCDFGNNRIRMVSTSGIISTIAGNGTHGFSGDGGLAINSEIRPYNLFVDNLGNIYVVDRLNFRIRKITTDGIINTIAGNGINQSKGDGGLAISSSINYPFGIIVDNLGNIVFSEENSSRIRKITTDGIINTIAGNGIMAFKGDGNLAVSSELFVPRGISIDNDYNIYITDVVNNRIRKIYNSSLNINCTAKSLKANFGQPSTAKQFSISGKNLSTDITINGSVNLEFSKDQKSDYATSLSLKPENNTLENIPIYFRLRSIDPSGIYNDNITINSSGLDTKYINLIDTVLTQPKTSSSLAESDIAILDAALDNNNVNLASTTIQAYPNPSKGLYKLTLNNFKQGLASINVIDAKGSIIQEREIKITNKKQIESIDLNKSANGSYFIQVRQASETKSILVVKE